MLEVCDRCWEVIPPAAECIWCDGPDEPEPRVIAPGGPASARRAPSAALNPGALDPYSEHEVYGDLAEREADRCR